MNLCNISSVFGLITEEYPSDLLSDTIHTSSPTSLTSLASIRVPSPIVATLTGISLTGYPVNLHIDLTTSHDTVFMRVRDDRELPCSLPPMLP